MKNTVKAKELWKFYENLALWCTTKIHRRDSPRMNRSLVERWGRLYRKMWRLRYDPGRQADETFEEVKAQIVKILEYHYRGLGLCYRQLRDYLRREWNETKRFTVPLKKFTKGYFSYMSFILNISEVLRELRLTVAKLPWTQPSIFPGKIRSISKQQHKALENSSSQ